MEQEIELRPVLSQLRPSQFAGDLVISQELQEAWDRYEALRAYRQLQQLRAAALSEVEAIEQRRDALGRELHKAGWL